MSDHDLVADFMARRGVTRCETGARAYPESAVEEAVRRRREMEGLDVEAQRAIGRENRAAAAAIRSGRQLLEA